MASLYPYSYNVTWHCSHQAVEPISALPEPGMPLWLALADRRGWSDDVPVPSLDLNGLCTPISVLHLLVCDLPENNLPAGEWDTAQLFHQSPYMCERTHTYCPTNLWADHRGMSECAQQNLLSPDRQYHPANLYTHEKWEIIMVLNPQVLRSYCFFMQQ